MPGTGVFESWDASGESPIAVALRVTDRLLLTVAVDGLAGDVSPAGQRHLRYPGIPRWQGHATALVELADPVSLAPLSGPIRWGLLDGAGGWTPATYDDPAGEPDLSLHPLAGDGRHLLARPTEPPNEGTRKQLPGRPVFSGGLLTGIEVDPGRIMPVSTLIADAVFRTVIEAATGRRLICEPLALQSLLTPWAPASGPRTPVELLRAEHEVVPFQSRSGVLQRLDAWRRTGFSTSVLALTGPAGSGKTRIARQFAADLQPRWAVGMLSEGRPAGWIQAILAADRPLLLVVEQPHRRIGQLVELVGRLATRTAGFPVRLLLPVRTVEGWWPQLREALGAAAVALDPTPCEVPPLTREPGSVLDHLRVAQVAYGRYLGPLSDEVEQPDLTEVDVAQPYPIHRAAVLHLLSHDPKGPLSHDPKGPLSHDPKGPLGQDAERPHAEILAGRELEAWRLELPAGKDWLAALPSALICPPRTDPEARQRMRNLGGAAAREADPLVAWLRQLFPPADPAAWFWSTAEPDRPLVDVLHALVRPAEVERLLMPLNRQQATTALSILATVATTATGTAATATTANPLLDRLATILTDYPAEIGPAAVELAARDPAVLPVLDRLGTAVRDGSAPIGACQRLANDLPPVLGPVARLARDVAERLIERYSADPAQLAAAHLLAGRADHELGDVKSALEQVVHAERLFQPLTGFRPQLVAAQRTHAARLVDLDRAAEAVAVLQVAAQHSLRLPATIGGTERAAIGQELLRAATLLVDAAVPDTDPAGAAQQALALLGAAPERAEAWRLLGTAHLLAGDDVDAVDALGQAVQGYREIAARSPGLFLVRLASALDGQATALTCAGSPVPAVATGEEAIEVQRQVTDQAGDDALAGLVRILRNQSSRLAAAGQARSALRLAQEAMEHAQRLYTADPAGHRPELALAATALSLRLAEGDRWAEAVRFSSGAVDAYSRLADEQPLRYDASLAAALHNHAVVLAELQQREDSVVVAQHAVDAWLQLDRQDPDRHRPALAAAQFNAAVGYAEAGDDEHAEVFAAEAVRLYGKLRHRFTEEHATALQTWSALLATLDRPADAITAAEQLVDVRRRPGSPDPNVHREQLAEALYELVQLCAASLDWARLTPAAEETAALYDELRRTDATRYRVALANAKLAAAHGRAALDEPAKAIAAAGTAITLYRAADLEEQLTNALELVSAQYDRLGDIDSAVAVAWELVTLHRRRDADSDVGPLVGALLTLSARLATAGLDDDALTIATEAVNTGQWMIDQRIDEYRPRHADALRMQSLRFITAGRTADGVGAQLGATNLLVRLAAEDPARYREQLAEDAALLSELEHAAGRYAESVEHLDLAVTQLRSLARDDPSRRPALAAGLCTLGLRLDGEELYDRGLKAVEEAVAVYRRLGPDAARQLAGALRQLADGGGPRQSRKVREQRRLAGVEAAETA